MQPNRVRNGFVTFVGAIVLTANISPALAAGQLEKERGDDRTTYIEIPFTKWILPSAGLPYPMEGFIGRVPDNHGFTGEVLEQHVSETFQILRIEAIYRVRAGGGRNFTALIQGGASAATGVGILDGVILNGWRTGARVHVRFQAIGCDQAPDGTCFQGTIFVERGSENDFQQED